MHHEARGAKCSLDEQTRSPDCVSYFSYPGYNYHGDLNLFGANRKANGAREKDSGPVPSSVSATSVQGLWSEYNQFSGLCTTTCAAGSRAEDSVPSAHFANCAQDSAMPCDYS